MRDYTHLIEGIIAYSILYVSESLRFFRKTRKTIILIFSINFQ